MDQLAMKERNLEMESLLMFNALECKLILNALEGKRDPNKNKKQQKARKRANAAKKSNSKNRKR